MGGVLPASPQHVWDAFTVHTAGWYWEIAYEPRVGGAERGLTPGGGTVTAWDPPRHFATRAEGEGAGFNELDYLVAPHRPGAHLRFMHRGVIGEDYDRQLDACRQHTAFYYHPLGEYLRHFRGRDAAYVAAEAPQASTRGGFAAVRRALGLAGDVTAGGRVRLTPAAWSRSRASSTTPRTRSSACVAQTRCTASTPRRLGLAGRRGAPPVRRRRRRGGERAGMERMAGRRLRDRGGGVMAQYAVLIFERETAGGVATHGGGHAGPQAAA